LAVANFVAKQGIGQDEVVVAGGASGSDAVASAIVDDPIACNSISDGRLKRQQGKGASLPAV